MAPSREVMMTVPGMYHEESIDIRASPSVVYDLVSDLPRMGEWSPENQGGEWLGDATGELGDRFEGHNRDGDREWSVVCEVTVASRPDEFQFVVAPDMGPFVRWSYRTADAADGGTTLTQVWDVELMPPTLVSASAEVRSARAANIRAAMAQTLLAIKATAESD